MSKPKLQTVTSLPLYTTKEALDQLNWSYTENENRFDDITCCGKPVDCRGFFGSTEDLECPVCGKHMHDLLGVTPVSNSTATMFSSTDYDWSDGKHWVAVIPEVDING